MTTPAEAKTTAIKIRTSEAQQEALVALLDDYEVEGFWQEDEALTVYMSGEEAAGEVRSALNEGLSAMHGGILADEQVRSRNWNEEWEQSIQPIRAGRFRVRPTWIEAATETGVTDLIIDPKMSFGTGHHESTRLLLSRMDDMVANGDRVLDAGTGTGVLGFAALACGAQSVDAFDFDPICIENSEENAVLNDAATRFTVVEDDGSRLEGEDPLFDGVQYDVVLANINREVLRGMLGGLSGRMKPDGRLGLAGLLVTDVKLMTETLTAHGLRILEANSEGDWWSVWAVHAERKDR